MLYEKNWLRWYYDDVEYGLKTSPTLPFRHELTNIHCDKLSYYDALVQNAVKVREAVQGPLDLMFSGGIDSEIILRLYKDLGIPINVYIFRYKDNLNHREADIAEEVVRCLNVPHKVIEFDVRKFFESGEAEDVWRKVYCTSSSWLPHMKMTEYLDGIPVFGSGEPYWYKDEDSVWKFSLGEQYRAWTLYHKAIGRFALCDWYEYDPAVTLAHMNEPLIKRLRNNGIPGKLSSHSSRIPMFKEFWPDIIDRPKLVGFENDLPASKTSKPDYMLAFDKEFSFTASCEEQVFTEEELLLAIG